MSESWLLFDGTAIANAAGSPSSQVAVPGIAQIEAIPDPKDRLDEFLFQAAGAPSERRGRNFKRSIARRRMSVAEYTVAEYTTDYSPLENVPAFRRFQQSLAERYPYGSARTVGSKLSRPLPRRPQAAKIARDGGWRLRNRLSRREAP